MKWMIDGTLLHSVWAISEDAFRPGGAAADRGDVRGKVRENLDLLAEAGFFGLGVRREDGGLGADEVTRREFTEIVASACCVTAFTQQLQIGIGFVASADNGSLKQSLPPSLTSGALRCGVALSHLRRAGTPLVQAERVPGGYRISGTIPWISAWDLLDCFVLGAVLTPGDDDLFVLVDKARAGAARSGSPISLNVMQASGAVQVTLRDLIAPDADVLKVCPTSDLRRAEHREITAHTALPLGCARRRRLLPSSAGPRSAARKISVGRR